MIEDSGTRMTNNELEDDPETLAKSSAKASMEAMSAGRHLHDCTVRRVWFRTKFVWRTRTTTLNSASGSRRRVDLSPCRHRDGSWEGQARHEDQSTYPASVQQAQPIALLAATSMVATTMAPEVKNSWGTS